MATSIRELKEIAREANELLRDIGRIKRRRLQLEGLLDERVQTLRDRYSPKINDLQTQEDRLVDKLVSLVMPKFALLVFQETKTIKLRNGRISLRTSPESLEISDDEARILGRIAHHGGLTRFTRLGKRTLDKEALKRNPDFVAKIKGLDIVRKSSVVIRPAKTQGPEIVRYTDSLIFPLPQED